MMSGTSRSFARCFFQSLGEFSDRTLKVEMFTAALGDKTRLTDLLSTMPLREGFRFEGMAS